MESDWPATRDVVSDAIVDVGRSRSWPEGTDTARTRKRCVTANCRRVAPCRRTAWCDRSGYIRTPRPMRPRVTPAVAGLLAHGSSPPTTFPGNEFPVVMGRRLAAYSCGGSRGIVRERTHRVPF